MGFGSPVDGDCVVLASLAWKTLQGSREAVGENDSLTRELLGLYKILSRLQNELANPTSLVNRANDERRRELEEHAADCEGILKVMNTVLDKYNALGKEQRRRRRLWQKVKFGNGEMKDLREIKSTLSAHTSAITMGFNLCSLDSPGKIETTLEAEEQSRRHGRSLRGIRQSLHWVIANMSADVGEGSVRSSYANDDKTFWRTLRKELVKEGYNNYTLQKHRRLIKAYVEELVNRGVLDDQGIDNAKDVHTRPRLQRVRSNFYLQGPSRIDTRSPSPAEHNQPLPISTTAPSVSEDVEMADVSSNEDDIIDDAPSSPIITALETPKAVEPHVESSEDSDLSSSTLVEEVDDHSNPPPSKQNTSSKLLFAVQIEKVTDEKFARGQKGSFDDGQVAELLEPSMDMDEVEQLPSESSETKFARSRKVGFNDGWIAESLEPSIAVDEVDEGLSESTEVTDDVEVQETTEVVHKPLIIELPSTAKDALGESTGVSDDKEVQAATEVFHEHLVIERASMDDNMLRTESPTPRRLPPVQIEDIVDDDFISGAHPNVFDYDDSSRDSDDERLPVVEILPKESINQTTSGSKQPLKRVRWAEDDAVDAEQRSSPCKYAPEDLPFIFHREFRDFDKNQELQDSSQVLMEEQEAGKSRRKRSGPSSRMCSFVTQNEYIPPATLYNLQLYRIPASYFTKFWHPARVPMYLHGNVFDGISFTHWIYGWTAYTFRDNSFEMSTVKRFGKQVMKLGAATTDIDKADLSVKRKLPRDLYDESARLWEDLENIVNDIMSEAEDRLAKKRQGGRLEVEFVKKFTREMIAGDVYYRPIEKFVQQTDAWCKKVRFHRDFLMLWELWAS